MDATRRRFLQGMAWAGISGWIGAEWAADVLAADSKPAAATATGTEGAILEMRLLASRMDAMHVFYRDTLGWPVERDGKSIVVQAGGTKIRYDPTPKKDTPYYHIAWAIPTNKFEAGKRWLAERTKLLVAPDGRDEFHFTGANRRAVYFADPANNILELIARDDLGDTRPGPFGLDDVLYVNHAGLVVADMDTSVAAMREKLGLEPTAPPTPNFVKLGDVYRHIVLVPTGRLWLPEMDRGAEVFAAEIRMHGPQAVEMDFGDLPYRVSVGPA